MNKSKNLSCMRKALIVGKPSIVVEKWLKTGLLAIFARKKLKNIYYTRLYKVTRTLLQFLATCSNVLATLSKASQIFVCTSKHVRIEGETLNHSIVQTMIISQAGHTLNYRYKKFNMGSTTFIF